MKAEQQAWFNGRMTPADGVSLSAMDLGLTVGLGVFETIVMRDGVTPLLDDHFARLEKSTRVCGLAFPDRGVQREAIGEVLRVNDLERGRSRVRITVFAKDQSLDGSGGQGHVLVTAIEQGEPAEFAYLVPVPMMVNERGATAGIKSTSYAEHLLAYRCALAEGGDEAVMCNSRGDLCECAMANLFLVRDGVVCTPELTSGCLPGVTRSAVLRLAGQLGIECRETVLGEDELGDADEVFITSSAREVQPAKLLGSELELPGPITEKLQRSYREMIRGEVRS